MKIWIDVEDASGNKLGDGPIVSALGWSGSPSVDRSGQISFNMPAADPKSALLAHKRIVRCWGIVDGALTELGKGLVERIEDAPGLPSMLRVSGWDVMSELARISVRDLAVKEQQWLGLDDDKGYVALLTPTDPYPAYKLTDLANCYDGNEATYESFYLESCSDPNDWPENARWLYVGRDDRFDRIRIRLIAGHVNSVTSTLEAQYLNWETGGWVTVSGLVDGTSSSGATFAQDGDIEFTRPTKWARYTALEAGNWFWIRLRVVYSGGQVTTDTVQLGEVYVYADQETTDGVNVIMALAPAGWTTSGYPATGKTAYLQFNGESVLYALRTLAEEVGEHFRLSEEGREIEWFSAFEDSGLHAIQPSDPVAAEDDDSVVVLTRLERVRDTASAISRIIPVGYDGVTLEKTTKSAPAGYTLNAAENYLERDSAMANWGPIEQQIPFVDVALQQPDSAEIHPEKAADALFDLAYEYLRKHSAVEQFFEGDVTKVNASLRPGHTLWVTYLEIRDGYRSIDIDTELNVMATHIQVDQSGIRTVGLEVATIDRPPQTDADVLAQTITDVQQMAAASGKMDNPLTRPGDIPVSLAGGAVTRVGAGGTGSSMVVRGGMPGWETKRRIPISNYPGPLAVDAAPETFLVVPPAWPATAREWRLHLDTAGSSNTTVTVTRNGSVIATCTLGAAAQEGYVTLGESLAAGDVLGRQITAAGSGAVGLHCALVCEEA